MKVKKVINFFEKQYLLFLFLVVFASFGLTLRMGVWLDDQGLFYKFAHVYEKAGYLGVGPWGEGLYRYVITPFLPIYKLFGYITWPYFALGLAFYFLATVVIYFVFKKVLGEEAGKIAGFLYGAGYIASDGIIRLITSVMTSLGIIFSSLWFWCYWNFYKKREYKWYFLSLAFYTFSLEFSRVRTHYLLAVVLVFEVIFFALKKKSLKSIFFILLRFLPFVLIYNHYFSSNAAQNIKMSSFVNEILSGNLYLFFGSLSTFSSLVIHDWIVDILLSRGTKLVWLFVALLVGLLFYKRSKKLAALTSLMAAGWWFVASSIFSTTILNLSNVYITRAFLGGVFFVIFFIYAFYIKKNYRGAYFLFLFWAIISLGAYGVFTPTVYYNSISRYLTHSFLALVGLWSVIFVSTQKKTVRFLVVLWGVISILSSVWYQFSILVNRTFLVEKFYKSLKNYVPEAKKGDVFYFSYTSEMRDTFNNVVAVASMDEVASLAWRYGVHKDDILFFNTFDKLRDYVLNNQDSLEQFYAFHYSDKVLTNVSSEVNERLFGGLAAEVVCDHALVTTSFDQKELVLSLEKPIFGLTPNELTLRIKGDVLQPNELEFPYIKSAENRNLVEDSVMQDLVLAYLSAKENFWQDTQVSVSSYWRNESGENAIDGDLETVWRPHRVEWTTEQAVITLDLGKEKLLNRLVWINAYDNSTPTAYKISVSQNGNNWVPVTQRNLVKRIDTKELQIVDFPEVEARFVRFEITDSLNGDAPGIVEIWVIPSLFSDLDIIAAEEFIKRPFDYLPDYETYEELANVMKKVGMVKLSWFESERWETNTNMVIDIIYDGLRHSYKITLPATSERQIEKIKLSDFAFPGTLTVDSVVARPLSVKELN